MAFLQLLVVYGIGSAITGILIYSLSKIDSEKFKIEGIYFACVLSYLSAVIILFYAICSVDDFD